MPTCRSAEACLAQAHLWFYYPMGNLFLYLEIDYCKFYAILTQGLSWRKKILANSI